MTVVLCVYLDCTTGPHDLNLLLVGCAVLSPLLLALPQCRRFIPRTDIPVALFILLLSISAILLHKDSFRWQTIALSWALAFYYAMCVRLQTADQTSPEQFLRLLRAIVYAYAATMCIQQLCVIADIPVFNSITSYGNNRWKLNALGPDTPVMSQTLGVIMVAYGGISILHNRKATLFADIRRYPLLWIAFCWCLFSTDNASAYVVFPVTLLPWYKQRYLPWVSLGVVVCAGIFLLAAPGLESHKHYRRLRDVGVATLTLDEQQIIKADTSMSARVATTLAVARDMNPADRSFWTGHGTDADTRLIQSKYPDISCFVVEGPQIIRAWYNYGFFVWLALEAMVVAICLVPRKPLTWLFALMAVAQTGHYNCPMMWLILLLATQYRIYSSGMPKGQHIAADDVNNTAITQYGEE